MSSRTTIVGSSLRGRLKRGTSVSGWRAIASIVARRSTTPRALASWRRRRTGTNGSATQTGWTVGTGVEWAFWNNWSVKAEYDYIDFGTKTSSIPTTFLPALGGGAGVSWANQNTLHVQQAKFGINC